MRQAILAWTISMFTFFFLFITTLVVTGIVFNQPPAILGWVFFGGAILSGFIVLVCLVYDISVEIIRRMEGRDGY